jgi:hypothetical protein
MVQKYIKEISASLDQNQEQIIAPMQMDVEEFKIEMREEDSKEDSRENSYIDKLLDNLRLAMISSAVL